MKFIIDAQLPPKLAEVMRREGYDAIHCKERELQDADDPRIYEQALLEQRIIVTKDEDFSLIHRSRVKTQGVIWLRFGNCGNRRLISLFLKSLPQAIETIETGEQLVEIRNDNS